MPFAAPMRLEADGLTSLTFNQSDTPHVAYVTIGDPTTRVVADNAPDANGTIDTTMYFGARAVTVQFVLDKGASSLFGLRSQIMAFTRPDLRPRLYIQPEADAPELMLTLRRDQAEPVTWQPAQQVLQLMAVSWVCPNGLLESAELHSVTAGAGGEVAQTGLTFNATPDFSFGGATVASGGALVDNVGNVPVWPVITMYGPFSAGTILRNDTTGLELEFLSTMSIVTGDWLRVDFASKTIVNSTGTSYYDSLDFASSTWWQIQPGENRIYMLPTTFTAPPASLLVEWRSGWL